MSLRVTPCDFDEACAFVAQHHRHHKPPVGSKFCLAVSDLRDTRHGTSEPRIVGVAIVGRPVARGLQDGLTLEVLRVATDGCRNACSALYGACRRATFALGYRRLVTYTLDTEPGASLRGAGMRLVAEVRGRSWDCPSRPRVDKHPTQGKLRWESVAR